jgi:hypothetical protein
MRETFHYARLMSEGWFLVQTIEEDLRGRGTCSMRT